MVDPYVEPTSGVLRNRLGITDAAELAKVEAQVAAIRELTLYKEARAGGPHDLDQLRMVHRRLFGEVYDWAGELRTVDIAKGGSLFAKAVHLQSEAQRTFGDLGRRDYLRGLGRAEFVREAGRLLADLNALHPFRDGNGRAQRAFLQLLARDAGWQFEWARVNAEVNNRLSAAAMVDPDALSPMLQDILSELRAPLTPDRLAMPRPPQLGLGQRHERQVEESSGKDLVAKAFPGPAVAGGRALRPADRPAPLIEPRGQSPGPKR